MFINNINILHIEPTTSCNAACPSCLRNFYSQDRPSLNKAEFNLSWFDNIDWGTPALVKVEGNFGDFIMHSDSYNFVTTAIAKWPESEVAFYTNGGARSTDFWKSLGELECLIEFGIDGLDQATHSRYRIGTRLDRVLKNAQAFIDAGGRAAWAFTEFAHNKHQTEHVPVHAKKMGFESCVIRPTLREPISPVVNKDLEVIDVIVSSVYEEIDYVNLIKTENRKMQKRLLLDPTLERIDSDISVVEDNVSCDALNNKTIYIDAEGSVMPCNYFGDTKRWTEICKHFNEDAKEYNINNDTLTNILDKTVWNKLIDSFKNNNPIKPCAQFCSKANGIDFEHLYEVKRRKNI